MKPEQLIALAHKARRRAYAPYSHFPVGAALLTGSGTVYTGVNVENASYGLSVCAERNAVFKAISEGETDFVALAVVTEGGVSPCGACRQVLAEFNLEMPVYLAHLDGHYVQLTVRELLPHSFGKTDLPA